MCEATFTAEDFGGWMEQMKSHYGEAHQEAMNEKANLSQEEKMSHMQKWMNDARERFDATEANA